MPPNTTINSVIEIENAVINQYIYPCIFKQVPELYGGEGPTLENVDLNNMVTDLELPDGDYKITITIQSK